MMKQEKEFEAYYRLNHSMGSWESSMFINHKWKPGFYVFHEGQ